MSDRYTEEDLEYRPVRQLSPQWEVYLHAEDRLVARVTQRYVAEPPYILTLLPEERDIPLETRDDVVVVLLGHLNGSTA